MLVAWLFSSALFSSKVVGGQSVLFGQTPLAQSPPSDGALAPQNPELFDAYFNQQPDLLFARDALREWHLPLWSPYIGAGEPTWATQQHAALFPVNWLATLFPFWQSLEWIATLKLLLAAVGMLLFLRRLQLRAPASLLGAIAYAFSSYVVDWLEHPLANTFVLVPWLLFATDRLADRARLRDAGWFALVGGATLLGGHPETALIAALPVVPWFAMRLSQARPLARADLVRRTLLLMAGGVLSFAIAAVVLLPFAEIAGQASTLSRGATPFPARVLLTFFAPELWGRPDKFAAPGGAAYYVERTAYFGAVPLVLAFAGFAARRSAPQIFCAVLAVVLLGYVFHVPGYTELLSHIPLFNLVNRYRLLVLCEFAGAVLAAYGLHWLLELEPGVRRRLLLGVAAFVATAPIAYGLLTSDPGASLGAALGQLPNLPTKPTASLASLELATYMRWTLFAFAGLLLILLSALPRVRRGALAAGVVAVAALDLVSFQRGFHPATPIAQADPPKLPVATALARLTAHDRLGAGGDMYPNMAQRFRIRDARAYDLPVLKRRKDLWSALGGHGNEFTLLPPEDGRVADTFGVRYELADGSPAAPPDPWRRSAAHRLLLINRHSVPRAFVAYDWRNARGEADALAKVVRGPGSAEFRSPVIEGAAPGPARMPAGPSKATFLNDGNTHVGLRVDARRPGWLVLLDTWYPGWRARLDGRRVPIAHANVAFRAVRVPAGSHTVAFDYAPRSVRYGALLTIAGILITGLLLLSPRLRRSH